MDTPVRVLLIGPSSPLAEAVLPELCKTGSSVVLISNENDDLDLDLDSLTKGSSLVIHEIADLLNINDWRRVIDLTRDKLGGLDLLLYFETVFHENSFANENEVEIVKFVMDTNFVAPVFAIRAALPLLQESKGQIGLIMAPIGTLDVRDSVIYGSCICEKMGLGNLEHHYIQHQKGVWNHMQGC